jgi:signal peptidase I
LRTLAWIFLGITITFSTITALQIITSNTNTPILLVVNGDSMYPTLKEYDLLILTQIHEKVKVGDIVAVDYGFELLPPYRKDYLVHRVTNIIDQGKGIKIVTKGDNNEHTDGTFSANDIRGKVISYIPVVGVTVNPPVNFIIILLSFAIFAYFMRN